ncbi:MAG TPA: pyroglutamyl-peptidase I [Patescibacteria group bacterium]|nr:pyroglutamyl-peptidase I [Patescibacteria group bacterium]
MAASTDAVLLVTAFAPFDGAATNASLILLDKLKEMDWQGRVVFFGPVPVEFDNAWPLIQQEMSRYPNLQGVLALGQAEGRREISLERVAMNWMDARIPDNAGNQPRQQRIDATAPVALKDTFPWHQLESSACRVKSYSAGTFVCNTLMFHLLRWAEREGKTAGFVHVPLLESQKADAAFRADTPRMDDARALRSIARIVGFSLETLDRKLAPGAAPEPPRPA